MKCVSFDSDLGNFKVSFTCETFYYYYFDFRFFYLAP